MKTKPVPRLRVKKDPPLGAVAYGQWYLFSRYLANQTKGLPGGGDGLYKTVFDCERDVNGLGACTTERLMEALGRMGYAGNGPECVVADFEELVLNYNTALAVRDSTGPYSLMNDAQADPSLIDGAPLPLLQPFDVPSSVAGGGAAAFVEVGDAALSGIAGPNVRENRLVSPLPLRFELRAGPPVGDRPYEGGLVSIAYWRLEDLPGARVWYLWTTEQEFYQFDPFSIPFEEYTGPTPFSAKAPLLVVQFSCDRGSTSRVVFDFEAAPVPPGEEGVPPDEAPGFQEAPGGQAASGGADPAIEPQGGGGDAAPAQGPRALASTGDPLALARAAAILALACAAAMALCAHRMAHKPSS